MTLGPLMVDVAGFELTDEDRRVLAHPLVGAVILSWLVHKPMPLNPLLVSKLNTGAQISLAGVVLAALGFELNVDVAIIGLAALVAALTLLSVVFYVAEWVRHMNAAESGR